MIGRIRLSVEYIYGGALFLIGMSVVCSFFAGCDLDISSKSDTGDTDTNAAEMGTSNTGEINDNGVNDSKVITRHTTRDTECDGVCDTESLAEIEDAGDDVSFGVGDTGDSDTNYTRESNGGAPLDISRGGKGILSVSAGEGHTCAVKQDGGIVCWGANDYGQAMAPHGSFVEVSAGAKHTCALEPRLLGKHRSPSTRDIYRTLLWTAPFLRHQGG